MFNRQPRFGAIDHEWLHYIVTGNDGVIADYEVTGSITRTTVEL